MSSFENFYEENDSFMKSDKRKDNKKKRKNVKHILKSINLNNLSDDDSEEFEEID